MLWVFGLMGAVFIIMGLRGQTGGIAGPWIGVSVLVYAFSPFSISQLSTSIGIPRTWSDVFADTSPVEAEQIPSSSYRISADDDGHFRVNTWINGTQIRMLVDTGASTLALSYEDGQKLGLDPGKSKNLVAISTANGVAYGAPYYVGRVEVGEIGRTAVEAIVMTPDTLGESLLGMSFLKTLTRYEIRKDEMIFVQ